MIESECPNQEQLTSFALGLLDDSQLDQLSEHVEHCPQCEQTLFGADTSVDSVVSQLRAPRPEHNYAEEVAFRQRIAVLEALGQNKSAAEEGRDWGPPSSKDAGPQLREYQLVTKLGQGGMGAVYKAIHTRLGKIVAIKLLSHYALSNEIAVERFSREIKAIGRLEHPNLIRAHDAGEVDGQHFLVMEYLDGFNLSQLVKASGPLPIAEACELIRQASLGLEYVHRQGLVHRDIKPSNLMLTTEGQVKVLDLGLALFSQIDVSAPELTSSGQIMGTVDFMAPEQGSDTHNVDIRADIYSLGATLYKLLTGDAPFDDPKRRTMMQKLTALATQEPQPIRVRRAEIPSALAKIVQKMLAKNPAQRFSSPAEVAQALQPFAVRANLNMLLTRLQGKNSNPGSSDSVPKTLLKKERTSIGNLGRRFEILRPVVRRLLAGLASFSLLLAAIVIFWPSPQGLVRIEINDEQILAQFDRDGLTVTGVDQQAIKVGNGPREIGAGTHKLVVRRSDMELETEAFEVNRNGRTVLKIELVNDQVQVTANDAKIETTSLRRDAVQLASRSKSGMGETTLPHLDIEWVQKVRALPPERQVEEVVTELRRRNSRFDGRTKHKIEAGIVSELELVTDHIADISPVRGLTELKRLDCSGSRPRYGILSDLTPLIGMRITQLNISCTNVNNLSPLIDLPLTHLSCASTPLTDLPPLKSTTLTFLNCSDTGVRDLSALKDLPLTNLSFSSTQVSDLSPLGKMSLTSLGCANTAVSDLQPLSGMKLTELYFSNTQVTDLSPLIGMPLRAVKCNLKSVRDREIMRGMETLNAINDTPVSEFWKELDERRIGD